MQRVMLKSKIHRATVTDCDLHYVGSITIDPDLLEAADILEHEQVHVVDVDNGARFETYTIAGERGSGEMKVNGAAARLVHRGDTIIVISYAPYDEAELERLRAPRRPRRAGTNQHHRRRRRGGDPPHAEARQPARRRPAMSTHAQHVHVPADASRLPMTLPRLLEKKRLGEPIVMVTAYDYPSARAAEAAGVDLVLVGDSRRDDRARLPVDRRRSSSTSCSCSPRAVAPRPAHAVPGRRPAVRLLRGLRRAGGRDRVALRQGGRLRRRQARGRRRDVASPAPARSSAPASRSWATSA